MSDKYLNLTGLGTLWAKIKTALAGKQDDLSAVLPTDASATNQLATKAYADAIGERLEARYLGSDTDGSPFATHADLTNATEYFYQGMAATPDTNDITTVTADEDHIGTTGEASTTRYRWNGTGWAFEYVINNTGLSEAQLLAVNSGITATKVSGYDGLSGKISDEASARQTADNAKLNIDGTNATSAGVVTILKQVPTGTTTFTDYDNILGSASSSASGDANSKKTVRRPVTDLWNYVKGKIAEWLGADSDSSGALVNKSETLTDGAVQRVHGASGVNCWAAVAKRTDTGYELAFGIGSGGQNRGIWDESRNAWAFKTDSSNKDSIPGWGSIGSSGEPVYFDSNGRPAKCGPNVTMISATSGTETGFTAARSDVQAAITLYQDDTTHGLRDSSGSLIIRNADGNLQLGDSTLGNYYTPIFLLNGVPTLVKPENMNVGKASKLGSSNIGKNNRPIYLVAGEPTPCSATIGSYSSPIFLNNGEFTECDLAQIETMRKVGGYYSDQATESNRQGKYYRIVVATFTNNSKYSDFGCVFKVRVLQSQNIYSGTINAGYRRNNYALGSLAATISWDGNTPSSTTCKFGIHLYDAGTGYISMTLYSYTNTSYAAITAYFDGYASYNSASTQPDNIIVGYVQDPDVSTGVTTLPTENAKTVILNG